MGSWARLLGGGARAGACGIWNIEMVGEVCEEVWLFSKQLCHDPDF